MHLPEIKILCARFLIIIAAIIWSVGESPSIFYIDSADLNNPFAGLPVVFGQLVLISGAMSLILLSVSFDTKGRGYSEKAQEWVVLVVFAGLSCTTIAVFVARIIMPSEIAIGCFFVINLFTAPFLMLKAPFMKNSIRCYIEGVMSS